MSMTTPDVERLREQRFQESETVGQGGELVAEDFSPIFSEGLRCQSALLQIGTVLTSRGNTLFWPGSGDTDQGVISDPTVPTDLDAGATDITFRQKTLSATGNNFTSGFVRASNELLQDGQNAARVISDILARRLARRIDAKILPEIATSMPAGQVEVAALSAAAIGDMLARLDSCYFGGQASWLMTPGDFGTIVSQNSSVPTGGQLDVGVVEAPGGFRPTIIGYPVFFADFALGVGTRHLWFGDLAAAVGAVIFGEERVRMYPERYADLDQTGFLAAARVDGDLVEEEAVVAIEEP